MKRVEFLEMILSVFNFKIVSDLEGNEFILLSNNPLKTVDLIQDKTQFEALENHIHILDNIKPDEYVRLCKIAPNYGKALLGQLIKEFPDKHFIVYVTIKQYNSMIVRFHQDWPNEEHYYSAMKSSAKEKILTFKN